MLVMIAAIFGFGTHRVAAAPVQQRCTASIVVHTAHAPAGCAAAGTIVPLYMDPGPVWASLEQTADAHPAVPVIAIVNPDSGPGTSFSSEYATGIRGLLAHQITPIGYVWTDYGGRSITDVEADIAQYHAWYPALKGVFLDGMAAAPGFERYYSSLSSFAKRQGLELVVGNPGTNPAQSYVGTVDIINIYENGVLPDPGSLLQDLVAPTHYTFSMLAYNTPSIDPSFVQQADTQVGWIYLTNDTLPNPWDTLPPYLGQLLTLFSASRTSG